MNNKMLSIITLLAVLSGLPTLTMSSETSSIERYVDDHRFISNGNAHYDRFTGQYLLFLPPKNYDGRSDAYRACTNDNKKVNEVKPKWRISSNKLAIEVCKDISTYKGLSGLKPDENMLAPGNPTYLSRFAAVLFDNDCKHREVFRDKHGKLRFYSSRKGKDKLVPGSGKLSALCVANEFGPKGFIPWYSYTEKLKVEANKTRAELIYKQHKEKFEQAKNNNTHEAYQNFISIADKDSIYVQKAKHQIMLLDATSDLKKLNNNSSLDSYIKFVEKYPDSKERGNAEQRIFELIKKRNNISGLEWFVSTYPTSKVITDAIAEIHKLAYVETKTINTLSAYNTYLIAYPYSEFTEQALSTSLNLEEDKYDAIDKDDERKARLLAVKIKKMTIKANKASKKAGYEQVINRMSELLTSKYEETDASLRYYESKEFTDFASRFDRTMSDIKRVLSNIENNTDGLMDAVKEGFANADADRDMAAFKLKQHEEWEKYMHLMDKGYN